LGKTVSLVVSTETQFSAEKIAILTVLPFLTPTRATPGSQRNTPPASPEEFTLLCYLYYSRGGRLGSSEGMLLKFQHSMLLSSLMEKSTPVVIEISPLLTLKPQEAAKPAWLQALLLKEVLR
jgi:hypothetical protein